MLATFRDSRNTRSHYGTCQRCGRRVDPGQGTLHRVVCPTRDCLIWVCRDCCAAVELHWGQQERGVSL